MAEFKIYPQKLKNEAESIKEISQSVNGYRESLQAVTSELKQIDSKMYSSIIWYLKKADTSLEQSKNEVNFLGKTLTEITEEYTKTEESMQKTTSGKIEGTSVLAKAVGSVKEGTFLYETKDGNYKWNAFGAILGGEVSATAGYDTSLSKFGAYASAEASGYGIKGEFIQEGAGGLDRFKASGEVFSASAKANTYATLIEDGKIVPAIGAEVAVNTAVAKGKVEERFGNDEYNIGASAEGSFLDSEAEAGVKAGVIEDDGGTRYGVEAEVGAGVYLAKGEVKGEITIKGIEIEGHIGGKVGLGANAEAKITSDSAEIEWGIAALLGGDAGFSIDWSNFEW